MEGQIKHLSDTIGLCCAVLSFFHTSRWPVGQIHQKNAFDEPERSRNPTVEWPARIYITLYNMSDAFIDVVKPAMVNKPNAFWLHEL